MSIYDYGNTKEGVLNPQNLLSDRAKQNLLYSTTLSAKFQNTNCRPSGQTNIYRDLSYVKTFNDRCKGGGRIYS